MSPIERFYEFTVQAERERVFELLADARRLNDVTPRWFDLTMLSGEPERLRDGAEIEYWLRWRGLRVRWRSRIFDWNPGSFFAYEQVKGPFRSFVHEHYFFDTHEGTRVVDRVVYAPPGGALSDRLLVAADLGRIFSWRASAVKATLEPAGEASVRFVAVAD